MENEQIMNEENMQDVQVEQASQPERPMRREQNAGTESVLVMSGETTREILDASPDKPDLVLSSAKEIIDIITNVKQ